MKSATQLLSDLAHFTGSEAYHRWSQLFPRIVMTDGAKYLAEEAECFWLMDVIASHMISHQNQPFAVAKLQQVDGKWLFTLDDGNGNIFARQEIEFSTFPLDSVRLFVETAGGVTVILLPSEH